MKKFIKWTLIVVPILLIIAIVVVLMSLNGIVRSAVETQTTASTTLETKLAAANVSILGGTVNLSGLQIGSPKGFAAPTMFAMQDLKVGVNYSQLTKNPIHIAQIVVEAPHLTLEQNGTQLNVKAAMAQMPKSESSSSMRLIIDTLTINNTQVTIKTNLPLVPPETNLQLPPITLTNIGNDDGAQNGAAIKDVIRQVFTAMLAKAEQSGKLPPGLGSLLNLNTDGVEKAGQDVRKQLDQGLKDLLAPKKK